MIDVTIGCLCPGHPHDSDTVQMREQLDFRRAAAIKYAVLLFKTDQPSADAAEVLALLSEQYLVQGIEAWSLRDDKDQPIPVSREAIVIFLLTNLEAAGVVAERADELYSEAVMLPLLQMGSTSSRPGPTNGSTSATNGSSHKPRKRSKPSSTSTTPMADTVTITSPPAGGSSTSQS